MPMRTENGASTKSDEWAEQEHLEFDDDDEEEVEYEEIEEEVEEYEEVQEVEQKEEDPEESELVHGGQKGCINGEDEKEKHAELLSLPPHGSEVFIGGISRDASSEDLRKLCESVVGVVEVRMRVHGKGGSRLYAFVNFRTKDLALKAVRKLNNRDLNVCFQLNNELGKKIRLSSSQAKNKLFIGNVPHNWTHDEFKKAVEKVGPGVLKVDLTMVPRSDRNKGFGFIEYYNQACAEYARQKMSTPDFKLDTNAPTVCRADPKNGESASTAQVKSLYVKNLPKTATEEQLRKLFEHLGEITKVVLPPAKSGHGNRYGFVHFNAQGAPLLPSYTPLGYGLAGAYHPQGNGLAGAYGVLPACTAQPLLYAPGLTMVPMVLRDGLLVYVPQPAGQLPVPVASPPPQPGRRHSGAHGGSARPSSGGRRQRGDDRGGNNNNSRRCRHRPY